MVKICWFRWPLFTSQKQLLDENKLLRNKLATIQRILADTVHGKAGRRDAAPPQKGKSELRADDLRSGEINYLTNEFLRKQDTVRKLHALNNRLSVILGNLELVSATNDTESECLADCREAAESALDLVARIYNGIVLAVANTAGAVPPLRTPAKAGEPRRSEPKAKMVRDIPPTLGRCCPPTEPGISVG